MSYNKIPNNDILGNQINIGDKVALFSRNGISFDNCTVVERFFDDEEMELRKAFQVADCMWIFGVGSHEVIKITGK